MLSIPHQYCSAAYTAFNIYCFMNCYYWAVYRVKHTSPNTHFTDSPHSQLSLLLPSSFFSGSFHMAKSSKCWANWLSLPPMHHLIWPVLLYLPPLLRVHKSQLNWLPSLSLPLPSSVSYSRHLLPKVGCSSRESFVSVSSVPCFTLPPSLSLVFLSVWFKLLLLSPHPTSCATWGN